MPQTQIISLPVRHRDGVFLRFVNSLIQANQRRAQRQILSRLDPHMLRDIGLDAEIVAKECAKPFWQP